MKKIGMALLALAMVVSLCGVGCGSITTTTYQVEYKVTGTAGTVSLTYTNKDGGTSQESNVSLPWTHSFTAKSGSFVYVSAQNMGASGTVTTTIYRDGKEFKTSTSTGGYVIATSGDIL
jgi:uncharacterized protein YceK